MSELQPDALQPPAKGEHFAIGELYEHGNAVAVHKEAAKLTEEAGSGDTLYPTAHSREVMKKIARGEDLDEGDVFVSRATIAQARKNVERFMPEQMRRER